MKLGAVFRFEARYRLRRPSTWIFIRGKTTPNGGPGKVREAYR
jgi:hypothetical protein